MTTTKQTPPVTTDPSVRVHARADDYGTRCDLDLSAHFQPFTDLLTRAGAKGLPGLRADITAACAGHYDVKKYRDFDAQVRTARSRVAETEAAIERTTNQKARLEASPPPDVLHQLRIVTAEIAAAEAARAAAANDLETLEGMVPALWVKAANGAWIASSGRTGPRFLELMAEEQAAHQKVKEACAAAEHLIARVLAEHLEPVIAEWLVVIRARVGLDDPGVMEEIRTALIGAAPPGVRPADSKRRRFELVAAL